MHLKVNPNLKNKNSYVYRNKGLVMQCMHTLLLKSIACFNSMRAKAKKSNNQISLSLMVRIAFF